MCVCGADGSFFVKKRKWSASVGLNILSDVKVNDEVTCVFFGRRKRSMEKMIL